jgi:hypothetical protein
MTILRVAVSAAAVLILLGAPSARLEACSCTPTPTPAPGTTPAPKPCLNLAVANEAYVGQVQSVDPGPSPTSLSVRLTVGETFKGMPGPEETVITATTTAMCGIPFQVAQQYLVYTKGTYVGMCDGTKAVRFATYDLGVLRSGQCTGSPTPTPTPTPTPPSVFPGHYKIVAQHSGKALAVSGASRSNGASVVQWTYGGAATNDEWRLVNVGDTPYYQILARHSGKAMVVKSASTAEGATVIQWTYGGAATNDEWSLEKGTDGYYRIRNRNSGQAAEVDGGSTANGAKIVQRSASGGAQQRFAIVAVP